MNRYVAQAAVIQDRTLAEVGKDWSLAESIVKAVFPSFDGIDLTAAIFQTLAGARGGPLNVAESSPETRSMADAGLVDLWECSYPDYEWTAWLRNQDDAMWQAAIANMGKIDEAVLSERFQASELETHTDGSPNYRTYGFKIGEHPYESIVSREPTSDEKHVKYSVDFSRLNHAGTNDFHSIHNDVDATDVMATVHKVIRHHLANIVAKHHGEATKVTYTCDPTSSLKDMQRQGVSSRTDLDPLDTQRGRLYVKVGQRIAREDKLLRGDGVEVTRSAPTAFRKKGGIEWNIGFKRGVAKHVDRHLEERFSAAPFTADPPKYKGDTHHGYTFHVGGHEYTAAVVGEDHGPHNPPGSQMRYTVNFGRRNPNPDPTSPYRKLPDYTSTTNDVDATDVLATVHKIIKHHLKNVAPADNPHATKVIYGASPVFSEKDKERSRAEGGIGGHDTQRGRLYAKFADRMVKADPLLSSMKPHLTSGYIHDMEWHLHSPGGLAAHVTPHVDESAGLCELAYLPAKASPAANDGFDFELERFATEPELHAHMKRIFSGVPTEDEQGPTKIDKPDRKPCTIHIKSREEAHDVLARLVKPDDPDMQGGWGSAAHKFTGRPKPLRDTPMLAHQLAARAHANILDVIDEHFPA